MKQIILHTGRCGSTKLWAILDRYYRAKYSGDNTEGSLKKLNRRYNLLEDNYFGLFEFYSPRFCEMAFKWGDQVVYQFQLTKNYKSTPVTRDYIYQ